MNRSIITKFCGINIRELEDFPFSEVSNFTFIPNELNTIQIKIDKNQALLKNNYLYRDTTGKYTVLIEKKPIVDLLEEFNTQDFPKDFLYKLIQLL